MADIGRTDRGFERGGEPPFSAEQRLYLLERDLDAFEKESTADRALIRLELAAVRQELRDGQEKIRKTVTSRLNVLVAIGFSLLLAIISVLVTVVANRGGP